MTQHGVFQVVGSLERCCVYSYLPNCHLKENGLLSVHFDVIMKVQEVTQLQSVLGVWQ